MTEREVSYSSGSGASGIVTIRVPESLQEALAAWGEDVVLQKAIATVVRDAQRIARAASSPEAAQETLNKWVPGITRASEGGGVSLKAIMKKLKELPPDKRREVLDSIQ